MFGFQCWNEVVEGLYDELVFYFQFGVEQVVDIGIEVGDVVDGIGYVLRWISVFCFD